jgi:predicted aspartyl protease
LIATTWVNGVGSFDFVIDTGVGTTLISERVAQQANIQQGGGATVRIAGLSGIEQASGRKAVLGNVALGGPQNVLPGQVKAIVTNNLPPGVDGVLEPTDAYWPLGFAIDFPRSEISAFDPRAMPIRASDAPEDGAVVPWLYDGATRRPFVMLSNGRRALLDTGSAFGFAVSENVAHETGLLSIEASENRAIRDIGGSSISSRRVSPATIAIGGITLRRVPTDILSGVESNAPILLGRDALRPFHIAFDPLHRLILIAPSSG